jgi:hypothetical protein
MLLVPSCPIYMYITNVSNFFFLHIEDPRLLSSPDFAAVAAELATELPN